MWQMGGPGPFLGQVHHFVKFNPGKSAYAEERYTKEARRLWSVLDRRLAEHEYVADDYSIAVRYLALDFEIRVANRHARRLSQCQTLVRGNRGAAGGAKGVACAPP
jgi:glutathione S-transferase